MIPKLRRKNDVCDLKQHTDLQVQWPQPSAAPIPGSPPHRSAYHLVLVITTSQHEGSKAGSGPLGGQQPQLHVETPHLGVLILLVPWLHPPVSLLAHNSPTQVTCMFLDAR